MRPGTLTRHRVVIHATVYGSWHITLCRTHGLWLLYKCQPRLCCPNLEACWQLLHLNAALAVAVKSTHATAVPHHNIYANDGPHRRSQLRGAGASNPNPNWSQLRGAGALRIQPIFTPRLAYGIRAPIDLMPSLSGAKRLDAEAGPRDSNFKLVEVSLNLDDVSLTLSGGKALCQPQLMRLKSDVASVYVHNTYDSAITFCVKSCAVEDLVQGL